MSNLNTKLLHDCPLTDCYTGASSIPKYQCSTFHQILGNSPAYTYTRFGNPTVKALEEAICCLQQTRHGFAFASGMAAISATLMLLNSGEHIILPLDLYGGTFQFMTQILSRFNVTFTFVDYSNTSTIEKAITQNTRAIYIETPSNPLLKVSDIKAITTLAKQYNLLTFADNTFMGATYQNPIDLGCDIVIESMTKFINGHSDATGGLVATNNDVLAQKISTHQKLCGGIIGTEDAWLILRGMKTLGLRLTKCVENANKMAEFLSTNEKIKAVYHPSVYDDIQKRIHEQQSSANGAVLSFEFYQLEDMHHFIKQLKLPLFAVSLGGIESILSHPASMSHAGLTPQERQEQGISDTLLRLSCGIEDFEDLKADFLQALQ